jgi:alpha-glucosidase
MCEPTAFRAEPSGTLADDVQHQKEGLGGSHVENHNVYGMQMARATQQALIEYHPEKRPVNMLRAGYAGTQRYASSWTGDNASTWDHLKLSISMTLNMGLSGAPLTGPDVGGFYGNADAELVTRWNQAACLMPYFRNHTALGTAPQEPWAFGQPYETINRRAIELRYRLMPYLYSIVALSAEYGWPIIRPLFMLEPGNPEVRLIDDCYLLGDGLLVAPVVERGMTRRKIYLPQGSDWYDFWTNELYRGGEEIITEAPLDSLPIFVRAGLALPMWPEMQYSGERPLDRLTLRHYPGNHETSLYEDEGEGLAYQQGMYRWVYITASEDSDDILLSRRTAGSYEPEYQMISLEVVGLEDEPAKVRIDRQGAPLWFFDEGILEITVSDFRDVVISRKSSSSAPTLPKRPW